MYSAPYILPAMSSGYRPERVKTLRVRLGMTQKQLAEAAGTSQGDVSRIERGETGVTADDAKRGRLARALGTTVGVLQRLAWVMGRPMIYRVGANERGAWAPSGWELLPEHVERNVVNGVRATGKAQRARWGAKAWPCEMLGPGGVVIVGECDPSS